MRFTVKLMTYRYDAIAWWRHQMETFSALLALCAGNSLVTDEFPAQRPVTWSFYVFFDLHLNQQLSKQWRRRWFETPSRSLWRHCNGETGDATMTICCLLKLDTVSLNVHGSFGHVAVITYWCINTLRPWQNGSHFPDEILGAFSWIKIYEFWWRFYWSLAQAISWTNGG